MLRRWLPAWYLLIVSLVVIYLGAIVVFYATGAGGFRVKGVDVDFGRQHDSTLFRIDGDRAFLVSPANDVELVRFQKVTPLLRLCGCYDLNGWVGPRGFAYERGDWVYVDDRTGPVAAINLDSGRTLSPGALAENGLRFDAADRLTPERVARSHERLWTAHESCQILLGAGLGLFVLLALIAPVAIVLHRRKTSRKVA